MGKPFPSLAAAVLQLHHAGYSATPTHVVGRQMSLACPSAYVITYNAIREAAHTGGKQQQQIVLIGLSRIWATWLTWQQTTETCTTEDAV